VLEGREPYSLWGGREPLKQPSDMRVSGSGRGGGENMGKAV